MRIMVFGGSFDPPHRGHLELLKSAARVLKPDRILIAPAYRSPLKDRPGAKAAHRLRMVRLGLLEKLPASARRLCRISDWELRLKRKVYTVETLRRLKRLAPRSELNFVTGSDSAASFPRWKNPGALRKLARWWTGLRPGGGRPPAHFRRLPGRFPDVSSTEIRRGLALGRRIEPFLEGSVLDFIKENRLYGLDLLETLKASLSPERYAHSLAVADWAGRLALKHGLNRRRAELAGLLHDLGRSIPVPRMAAFARRHRIQAPAREAIIRHSPLLLHAYLSAYLARRRLGVKDPEVLSAVRSHTLGAPRMSRLDKALYVADATSADRRYPGVAALRSLALRDLEEAFRSCLKNKRTHARSRGGWLHPGIHGKS